MTPTTPRDRRALRVLIVAVNYAPELTGTAPYTAALAEGLQGRGHRVRVLTSFPHYPQWSRPEEAPRRAVERLNGVSVERHRHYVPDDPTAAHRALYEVAFGARVLARGWAAPDVVLAVSPALLSTTLTFARARCTSRRPALGLVIQDLYSAGVSETGTGGGLQAAAIRHVESLTARMADGVVVIHEQLATRVHQDLGVPLDRVKVIRNWARFPSASDFDEDAFRASMGWRPEETVVLHAGAEGVKQGLENVVDAAALADATGAAVRFVLVGDGSQRRTLEDRARDVRSIQFLDSLEDPTFESALAAADVLLVNERAGVATMCVPSKLTSYFTAGRPVLAAVEPDSTAASELARAQTGIRVEPSDARGLLAAAIELGAHPERAAALAARGERYAHVVLGQEAALDAYDTWIRDLRSQRDIDERCQA